jgi:sugar phosphate isomerase/epimerase
MIDRLSRRQAISVGAACLGAATLTNLAMPVRAAEAADQSPLRYCLNTATIRGQKLSLAQQVAVAAKAGYQGIEPWVGDVQKLAEEGGSLDDLRKQIADAGLTVESAIGFPAWCIDDDEKRAQGMEHLKRDMDLVLRIGGKRIAAPPAGAHGTAGMDLRLVGQRYRAVLEVGRAMGVVPQLEIWGSSKTLGRVSEAIFVATEANHPDACLLLDAYHMYKGSSDFTSIRLLNGAAMHMFHINDYPADPPRDKIGDGDRVFPGDGVAPLVQLLADMRRAGFRGALSLELFNRDYWQRDALDVARTGLEKTKAVVAKSLEA